MLAIYGVFSMQLLGTLAAIALGDLMTGKSGRARAFPGPYRELRFTTGSSTKLCRPGAWKILCSAFR